MGVVLALLLAACEKEIAGASSGEKVALMVSLSGSDYVAAEGSGELKGLQARGSEGLLERVVVPLGEEEKYYLSATLKADPEELRAAPSDNQRITLAAFDASTNGQVGSAKYYYSTVANDLIPVTAGAPLMVDADKTYYIVAYSYNSTTTDPATANIDPANDLLWGKSGNKYITASDRTVSITMKHLFSRIKVQISSALTNRNIATIGTVKVEGRKLAGLTLGTGALTPGADLGAMETQVSGSGQIRTSVVHHLFYPSPTKVTISSVALSGVANPFTNLEANFTQVLEAGKSYLLQVDLAQVNWAHSNIYWVNTGGSSGYLTFDKYPPAYPSASHADYQGDYFKGASLIGVEPASYGDNHRLLIPNVGSGTWDGTKYVNTSHSLWANAGDGWNYIPFLTSYYLTPGDEYYNYPDFANYKGDICSYMTNGFWRLPTGLEFETNYDPSHYDNTFASLSGGSTGLKGVVFNSPYGPVFFPASGGLYFGAFSDLNTWGEYWCGTVYLPTQSGVTVSFGIDINDGQLKVEYINNTMLNWAFSVRCIAN
jgi:hypothetical protein